MPRGRSLRAWEIALFVWAWQAATLTVATSAAVMTLLLGGNRLTAFIVFYGLLLIDPCRRWEKRSWANAKASHQR